MNPQPFCAVSITALIVTIFNTSSSKKNKKKKTRAISSWCQPSRGTSVKTGLTERPQLNHTGCRATTQHNCACGTQHLQEWVSVLSVTVSFFQGTRKFCKSHRS